MLLSRGRLPLTQIIRFSKLKPRTVRAAILVLVQHNILWHAETDVEGEVLEFNVDECLTRIRYGSYVWLSEQLFGKAVSILVSVFTCVVDHFFLAFHCHQARDIVELVLDHGKLRPPEIITRLSKADPVKGSYNVHSMP